MLEAQKRDENISTIVKQIRDGKETEFEVKEYVSLYFKDRVCVPNDSELKKAILKDILRSCVIDYEDSWDRHILLVEFVYNNSFQSSIGMVPYEALYGRKCRIPLCLTELKEKKVIGPDLIQETEEKVKTIRERLKIATDRQKSYADMKRKDVRHEIGDKVLLKVSPWKKEMRFKKKGKLSLRFISPYEVIEKLGPIAYRLALPPEQEKIHNVSHHMQSLWRQLS